jgi:hypothetical protein
MVHVGGRLDETRRETTLFAGAPAEEASACVRGVPLDLASCARRGHDAS